MKRFFLILLILCILGLSACGQSAPAEPASTTATATTPPEKNATTTLMVYMLGSDLEAKAAAGTSDLEEMAASGADLSTTNVFVYAGGTPYWHNGLVEKNSNAILQLTADGFRSVHTEPAVSMGEAETLTGFLNYCYETSKTDHYALILWNHGNGPVMGYGMDLVFAGGSLLLTEMEQALDASVFGPENRLRFVGFDACLMASAELACIWDDYADYLVSSQEIEPSIGWNYSFLPHLTNPDTEEMLRELTQLYLSSCQDYYEEKGYDFRETTLSCVDLSGAADLEQAINALFTRASEDVTSMYDKLSALRVGTRAFGRASTGSEYDLVDLGDMATQLEDLYPEEAARLQQTLEQMLVSNATNTEICSGLSLYYPFYNKDYYYKSIRGADSWQSTYQDLALFPAYQQYLEKYQQIWNGSDRKDAYAASNTPTEEEGTYRLRLTPEQQSCYASAKYYILQREAEDLYRCLFVSSDVTNRSGVLEANFDGKVIYTKNKYQDYALPFVREEDRISGFSHYSIFAALTDHIPRDNTPITEETESYRYHLILNQKAETLAVSALLPYDSTPDLLTGGKLEDTDLSRRGTVFFMDVPHIYLTRDENGVILSPEEWLTSTWMTGAFYYLADEVEFVYEPLEGGEFYLLIEVQDTQGSRYCSEPLPIRVPDAELPQYEYSQVDVTWESGDRILVAQQNGVAVYMNLVQHFDQVYFTLELENNTDFAADLHVNHMICNDNIYLHNADSIHSEPGQSAWFDSLTHLGAAEQWGALENLTSIACLIDVRSEETGEMLIPRQNFRIALSEEITEAFRNGCNIATYYNTPFGNQRIDRQVIHEDENLQVTLLAMGTKKDTASTQYSFLSEYDTAIHGVLKFENRSDKSVTLDLGGLEVNGIVDEAFSNAFTIPAAHTMYIEWRTDIFQKNAITQIDSCNILLRFIPSKYGYPGVYPFTECPVITTRVLTEGS